MNKEIDIEIEGARADLYGFLSMLLTENLTDESLGRLLTKETVLHLEALFPGYNVHKDFAQLVLDFSAGRITTEDIMLDFEALLRIPGPAYIYPYESSYMGRANRGNRSRWGSLNGPPARDVQSLYENEHLSVRNESIDFPDHIGVELEFMSRLCRQAAQALDSSNEEAAKEMRAKQRHFFKEHLSQWPLTLAEEMRAKAATLLYRSLADLLIRFLHLEAGSLSLESRN